MSSKPTPEKNTSNSGEFVNASDIPLKSCYPPETRELQEKLGTPGQFPFTRGVYPTMYRGRLWTMRQYAGFSSAAETNRRFRYLLEHGQTGLSVAFDLPTQIGYDSDHSLAKAEMGKVGVPINSLHDMEILLEGIPLDRVSTSMTINATASILLAMYVAIAKKQNVPKEKIRGTVQNDILKEYAARGNFRFPAGPSLRLVTDILEYCAKETPNYNPISISGYHMREAGCTAVQEIAFTLADGIAYVEAAQKRGLDLNKLGAQLSFFFNAHNDLFEEVAKFRAARRLWAKLMKNRFKVTEPEAQKLRFHTQTAGSMLTSQQPDNNVVRVTVQALAAILGGTQSLHTNSRDEALSLPSEGSARLALRTQQVLAYESGVKSVADPLGGSPFIESLTDELEARSVKLIEEIDQLGGAVEAIEKAFIQREIHKSALAYQKAVEEGKKVVVGVNQFQIEEAPPKIFKPDPKAAGEVLKQLEQVRKKRNSAQVRKALEEVEAKAKLKENLMPCILKAVEAYATVGEICERLEKVFGKYQPVSVF